MLPKEKLKYFFETLISSPNDQAGIHEQLLAAKCLNQLYTKNRQKDSQKDLQNDSQNDLQKIAQKVWERIFSEINIWLEDKCLRKEVVFFFEEKIKPILVEHFEKFGCDFLAELLEENVWDWWNKASTEFKLSLLSLISNIRISNEEINSIILSLIDFYKEIEWDLRIASIPAIKNLGLKEKACKKLSEYIEGQKHQIVPIAVEEAEFLLKKLQEKEDNDNIIAFYSSKEKNISKYQQFQLTEEKDVFTLLRSHYWVERERAAQILPYLNEDQEKIFQALLKLFEEDPVFFVRLAAANSLVEWASKNKTWSKLYYYFKQHYEPWKVFSIFTSTPFYEVDGKLYIFSQRERKQILIAEPAPQKSLVARLLGWIKPD